MALAALLSGCFAEFPGPLATSDGGDAARPQIDSGHTAPDSDPQTDTLTDPQTDAALGADGATNDGQIELDVDSADVAHRDIQFDAGVQDARPDIVADAATTDGAVRPDGCLPSAELCNALDDDCDGVIDEDLNLGECASGIGVCARTGDWKCEDGDQVCGALAGPPATEVCNSLDDDCDGEFDEVQESCAYGRGACIANGTRTCQGGAFGECEPLGERPLPAIERCNAIDDDCDGRTDEDTCVEYTVNNCEVWLAQADDDQADNTPMASWPNCPDGEPQLENAFHRCNSSGGDGDFHHLPVVGDVDANDVLGIAWRCEGGHAEVDAWLTSHCAVRLGHVDSQDPEILEDHGTDCPPVVSVGANPNPRCVSTYGDGLYHPMWLRGDVDHNDAFGVAFSCVDEERPELAAQLTTALAVKLAWQYVGKSAIGCAPTPLLNEVAYWENCPDRGSDDDSDYRCASSSGDGEFHAFRISDRGRGRDVRACSAFGIALQILPPADEHNDEDNEDDENQ